jgi:hypothetical protein
VLPVFSSRLPGVVLERCRQLDGNIGRPAGEAAGLLHHRREPVVIRNGNSKLRGEIRIQFACSPALSEPRATAQMPRSVAATNAG